MVSAILKRPKAGINFYHTAHTPVLMMSRSSMHHVHFLQSHATILKDFAFISGLQKFYHGNCYLSQIGRNSVSNPMFDKIPSPKTTKSSLLFIANPGRAGFSSTGS